MFLLDWLGGILFHRRKWLSSACAEKKTTGRKVLERSWMGRGVRGKGGSPPLWNSVDHQIESCDWFYRYITPPAWAMVYYYSQTLRKYSLLVCCRDKIIFSKRETSSFFPRNWERSPSGFSFRIKYSNVTGRIKEGVFLSNIFSVVIPHHHHHQWRVLLPQNHQVFFYEIGRLQFPIFYFLLIFRCSDFPFQPE